MITPARRKNLNEQITDQIVAMIAKGRWKESERIPGELELAQLFEVSRNSVRESIKALELVGLLISRSGKGTFVSDHALQRVQQLRFSPEEKSEPDIVTIMEARLVVEPGLASLVAALAGEEDCRKLRQVIDASLEACKRKDYNFELGLAFHDLFYRISGNSILIAFFESLKESLVATRRKIFFQHIDEKVLFQEIEEHYRILDLIQAHDSDKAGAAMRDHIKDSLARLKKH
jgi:GntR family transcriptional regulator, transcriptional repressor for pyruvate dehydrogenase complex